MNNPRDLVPNSTSFRAASFLGEPAAPDTVDAAGSGAGKLGQRGIANTARRAGWQPHTLEGRRGWQFPIPYPGGTAHRWKAADEQKPKNKWLGGKPKACKYYTPQGIPRLTAAIAAAGGVIWIANGEPSLLAHIEAGLVNVVCWFGEGQPPHTLADDLKRWGVRMVCYPADKDAAGGSGAAKVRSRLKDSGIAFRPLQWCDEIPDGGDANDAWIAVGFDAPRFNHLLSNLKALLLPSDEPPPRRACPATGGQEGSREDAIAAIIDQARVRPGRAGQVKRNGDYANFCCLLHDEQEPSAGINTRTGTYTCFVCGTFKLAEICERLGIEYQRALPSPYTPKPARNTLARRSHSDFAELVSPTCQEADPYLYPGGIYPVVMQKAINHFCLKETGGATVAFLIQRGLQIGTITAPSVTFTQLHQTQLKLGWSIPETTLRRYFEGEVPFLHPRKGQKLECNSGTERTLYTIAETKEALKRRYRIDLHVKYFRDRERTNVDPTTGETYTLPIVPADLPAQAFVDAGYDEVTAHRMAEGLKGDPLTFDQPTKKRRRAARARALEAYNVFCQSLDENTVVAPAAEVHVASEGDFKRALARAWHGAQVDGFQTQSEQMWALGIASKHTLNTYLQAAGVEKVEHIEKVMLDPTKDVGKQIRENIRNLNAFPVTYVTGMREGGEIDPDAKPRRDLYDREKIDEAIGRGETVYVEYQQANGHEVVELPPAPAARQLPPQQRCKNDEGRNPTHRIKREIPTPGTYPPSWTLNHVRHRYRLHFGKDAPDDMPLEQLVYDIGTDILLRIAESEGAVVTRLVA